MEQRLAVNPIACTAHGICAEMLPELIGTDEWGYPVLADRAVPRELSSLARRAVQLCPTLALRLDALNAPRRAPTNAQPGDAASQASRGAANPIGRAGSR